MVSILLSGCSESSDSAGGFSNDVVEIGYLSKENVIPAVWEFSFDANEELSSIQWQFSDEDFVSHSSARSDSVTHTFNQAGVHQIRLRYETVSGKSGTAANDVIIQSGSISGTIFAALNTLVDVDTREPAEPNAENDSFASAQPLAANSRLSGVVDANDTVDYYQVRLQKDQTINLQVADQDNRSFETIQFQIFTSENRETPSFQASTEEDSGHLNTPFVVPTTGNYFIKLTAIFPTSAEVVVEGRIKERHSHGNYSLQIEAVAESADFVAGELIVMMKESAGNSAPSQSNVQIQSLNNLQGLATRMNLGRIMALSLTSARQFMAAKNISYSASLENDSRWQTLQVARLLAAQDDVLYAEPNWKRYPTLAAVEDPLYTSQWHYDSINLESAWQALNNRGSAAVTVAVLDTGVLTAHPDLASNLVAGYDFIDNDSDANDPGDQSIGGQHSSFHGTHVAGTIAAVEGNDSGGTGIAPGVKIMPVRVLGQDGGTSFEIIAGICFAAQLSRSDNSVCSNVPSANAADIINLSLGGPGFSDIEQAVYEAVVAKGIIVIAAAGNESTSAPFYPAGYDQVISVSATNRNTELASYSNFGNLIDVAAPGGDLTSDQGILSSWGDDRNGTAEFTYGYLQGTSMAAPHVAGVVALMKSEKPNLNHTEFRSLLVAGNLTQDIGDVGKDNKFGYGFIDAHKAVLAVLGRGVPKILTSDSSVFFDVSQIMRFFTLIGSGVDDFSELGTISVTVNDAENGSGGSWLALNKSSGLGEYIVTVARGNMDEGAYVANIVVSSDVVSIDDVVIEVVLQVGNAQLTANAGVQYVIIFDPDAEPNEDGFIPSKASSRALIAENGQYSYQITGLSKGRYTVTTGSDLDFDDFICDAGESCGQYPTLAQSSILVISEEQPALDINMTVNYLTSSIGAASVFDGELISPRAIKRPKPVIEGAEPSIEDTKQAVISSKSKQDQNKVNQ
ncbi:MAG: S8 family serine peptidase [Oleispira sp.]|nr:S8 family serine peptidase [Oleispira sp.]